MKGFLTMKVNKNSSFLYLFLAAILSLNLGGCARDISSGSYASGDVGEAVETQQGVIVAKREVTVKEGDKLQDNLLGLVGGGVAGGFLGHMVGGGRGKTLATVGGAAAGAAAGAYAQQQLSKQNAWEYTVKLDNGSMRTVVQGLDTNLGIGQRVLLQISQKGRSRVTPL